MVSLNNYFGFNKQQRNGLYVLMLISFLLLVLRLAYPYFLKPSKIIVQDLPLVAIENYTPEKNYSPVEKPVNNKLFEFDPNTVTLDQLVSLGFKEKTAETFIKFRNKGFVFKEKKDVAKIYGVSPEFYKMIESYIRINRPDKGAILSGRNNKPVAQQVNRQTTTKLELNTADSASLESLNGIGASYSKRILKYRSMLGGYTSIDQLHEVYGFTDELFEKIKNSVTADASLVHKININKDDFKTVNKHPYITYEVTKLIFDWRRKTTLNPVNFKEILNDPALYVKVLPYLLFD
jgi:competence protein ComEA